MKEKLKIGTKPKAKRQHFVPKFYLRNFSERGYPKPKSIGLFNPKNKIFLSSASIRNQCQRDYFYEETGELEALLSELEGLASKEIRQIIEREELSKPYSEGLGNLLFFITVQVLRTEKAVENLEKSTNDMFHEAYQYDSRYKDSWKNLKVGYSNPALFSLSVLKKTGYDLLFDLEVKILRNNTKLPFITSDDPVVKYNQFFEKKKIEGSGLGLSCKGLQIFFPVNGKHMVHIYDRWAYRVGTKRDKVVKLENEAEINSLNLLQVLNSHNNLFFGSKVSEQYMRKLFERSRKFTKTGPGETKSFPQSKKEGGPDRIILMSIGADPNIDLKVSKITFTKNAKRFKPSGWVTYLRGRKY